MASTTQIKARPMSLDNALEAFEATPGAVNAAIVRAVAKGYFDDDMICEDTYLAILAKAGA